MTTSSASPNPFYVYSLIHQSFHVKVVSENVVCIPGRERQKKTPVLSLVQSFKVTCDVFLTSDLS